MRLRIVVGTCALMACLAPWEAVAQAEQVRLTASMQMVGVFANTCLRMGGRSDIVRSFLREKNFRELEPTAARAVLSDHRGVAFDVSGRAAKLVIASEDNNTCSIFLIGGDNSGTIDNIKRVLSLNKINVTHISDEQSSVKRTIAELITLAGLQYYLVTSVNMVSKAMVQAVITLSPAVQH